MAYKSNYYDPQKAHEYYMKNRDLKGRKSTKGLNEAGKNTAKFVKEQLKVERKAIVDGMKTKLQDKIKAIRERMRVQLESLTPEEKEKLREEIRTEIDGLRGQFTNYKTQLKAAYDTKYEDELAKIKKDKQFLNGGKKKKRKLKY